MSLLFAGASTGTNPVLNVGPEGVSSEAQLKADDVVTGSGAPAHTPNRPSQKYTDTATGNKYTYYEGEWHADA